MKGVFQLCEILPLGLVRRVFADFEELFALSEDAKRACLREGFGGGYTPCGVEGVRDLPKDELRSFWDVVPGRNRFPAAFNSQPIDELCELVQRILLEVFDARYPQHTRDVVGGAHSLRVTHFRATVADAIIMPCHVDIGFFTGFIGGSRPGLEGKVDDAWKRIDNPVGDLLVAAGTSLRLYDANVIPFSHRVRSSGETRISLAYFLEPREDVLLPNGELARDRMQRIVQRIRRQI